MKKAIILALIGATNAQNQRPAIGVHQRLTNQPIGPPQQQGGFVAQPQQPMPQIAKPPCGFVSQPQQPQPPQPQTAQPPCACLPPTPQVPNPIVYLP
jgi:hypothetical protein